MKLKFRGQMTSRDLSEFGNFTFDYTGCLNSVTKSPRNEAKQWLLGEDCQHHSLEQSDTETGIFPVFMYDFFITSRS